MAEPWDSLTIEEDIPTGALSVTLTRSDLPRALPRAMAAFESGGPVEHEAVYLPGRRRPIYQIKQARERDMVLQGAFRDHLYVRDGGTVAFHARAMRDALERIRTRCNPVRITWGSEVRLGVMIEAKFGEESAHEIDYELTFAIGAGVLDVGDGAYVADGDRSEAQTAPNDVAARLRAMIAERQRDTAGLFGADPTVIGTLTSALSTFDAAVSVLESTSTELVTAPLRDALRPAARVFAAGRAVQAAAETTVRAFESLTADDVFPVADADALAAWFRLQLAVADDAAEISDQTRDVRAGALSRLRTSARVYVVSPGDTLESIARSQLGDPSRAGELGVRDADLVPGLRVRIPEVRS